MGKTNIRAKARSRRKMHIRKVIRGSSDRPRLCVFRSAKHMYAQVIDDSTGKTLVSASTMGSDFADFEGSRGNRGAAEKVGELLAERAKEAGIESVRFDRNGFLYHGRVKALADAARKGGLKF